MGCDWSFSDWSFSDTFGQKLTYYKKNISRRFLQDSFAHPRNSENECCYFMYSDWDGVWDDNRCDNRNNRVTHYACQYGKT